jgi:hypothetical protein
MNDHAELGQKFVETLRLYDPVCFDIGLRKNYDYRIVKIDHEEILCNQRIEVFLKLRRAFARSNCRLSSARQQFANLEESETRIRIRFRNSLSATYFTVWQAQEPASLVRWIC